jgi:hypothetical protein
MNQQNSVESSRKQFRVSVDMLHVDATQATAIVETLLPGLATRASGNPDIFLGFRYLYARYDDPAIAQASALLVKQLISPELVEVEEVGA